MENTLKQSTERNVNMVEDPVRAHKALMKDDKEAHVKNSLGK